MISKRFRFRISMGVAIGVTFVCWLGVVAEQGVGAIWQNVADRQMEYKTFDVNLGLFTPPEGVGVYRVTFFRGESTFQGEMPVLEKKPDIFIFMFESTRADAIRPEVAPFLSRFRDTECQELGETWSGSNATHLSWFSFFHSRVPIFWREALESITDREAFAGSVPLQQLKLAGYEIEVRAVCDLSYKDFGFSNFGFGTNLAKLVKQANDDSEFSNANIAERELQNFKSLRESVLTHPGGGGVYYTALDSPHYNYYWHEEFQPPFTEYDADTRFPLNPTKLEIQRVKNRYWNAVAWADSQVAEFCAFLKREGRYDESIIIVTGDHGEEFQEHGSWFHCSSLQPEQTRVPILIKWPKSMGRGPSHQTASHLDVMPSLLAAIGMPEATISGLAGKNLLKKDNGHTAITTTAYAGQSGETMVLHRGAYCAVFSWGKYWEAHVPETVVLERITGPDGPIVKKNAREYAGELRRIFPDAFERFFKTFDVVE
jgi:membrane-anchored protein YejM (alkaline phosphatase superfamily)